MSYGLKIVNSGGSLVISGERIVPRFVGKASYASQSASDGGTVLVYTLAGLTPGDLFVAAYTLPDHGSFVWYGQFGNQAVAANGSGVATISVRAQSLSGTPYPEVYVFTLSRPVEGSGGAYGLRLRDSVTRLLTYTTAQHPLMISLMPSLALGSSVMPEGLPAKPAFFPSAYIRIVQSNVTSGGPGPGSYNISGWFGGYRLNAGRLYTAEVQYVNQGGIGNLTPATFQYGSNASQPIPIINAAVYD